MLEEGKEDLKRLVLQLHPGALPAQFAGQRIKRELAEMNQARHWALRFQRETRNLTAIRGGPTLAPGTRPSRCYGFRHRRSSLCGARVARRPGFALTAVLSLALGHGATSAVFSVVYGVLINPFPYVGADA